MKNASSIVFIFLFCMVAQSGFSDVTTNWRKPYNDTINRFKIGLFEEESGISDVEFKENCKSIQRLLETDRENLASVLDPELSQDVLDSLRQELKSKVVKKAPVKEHNGSRVRVARERLKRQVSGFLVRVSRVGKSEQVLIQKDAQENHVLHDERNDNNRNSPRVEEKPSSHGVVGHEIIERIYSTKPGTLIFLPLEFPRIFVKMDNRQVDPPIRTYFQAFMNTQRIQKEDQFSLLFLPHEANFDGKNAGVKTVFSEMVPLFSEAEIDNRVLLHLLLSEAATQKKLRKKLQKMYLQMVQYICQVDFDDINFTNLPFAVDGRLAPFDTDSFYAKTGVFAFLNQFFAPRLFLSFDEISPVVDKYCRDNLFADLSPYKNEASLSEIEKNFKRNQKMIEKMIAFLQTKSREWKDENNLADYFIETSESVLGTRQDNASLAAIKSSVNGSSSSSSGSAIRSPVEFKQLFPLSPRIAILQKTEEELATDRKLRVYATIIDGMIEKKLEDNKNRHLFGTRCEHVGDFATRAALEIQAAFPMIRLEYAYMVVYKILQVGKEKNVIFSYGTRNIRLLASDKFSMRGFMCF